MKLKLNAGRPYWCCEADFGKHTKDCANAPKEEGLNPRIFCGESIPQ